MAAITGLDRGDADVTDSDSFGTSALPDRPRPLALVRRRACCSGSLVRVAPTLAATTQAMATHWHRGEELAQQQHGGQRSDGRLQAHQDAEQPGR